MRVAVCVALLFALSASAETYIKPVHRIPNRTGYQCYWVSVETLARHNGRSELYDLSDWQLGPAMTEWVVHVLRKKGVEPVFHDAAKPACSCEYCECENCDCSAEARRHAYETLRQACCEFRVGAVVTVPGHALLVVDITESTVTVLDNSGPFATKYDTWTRQEFDRKWTGTWLVIPPK